MSIVGPKPKKKFTGFTSFFKNAEPKKDAKTDTKKQPFTGFSEFYKKLKERELEDEGSECDSIILQARKKLKEIEKQKPPPEPEGKHFRPLGYYTWCKERAHQALERYQEEPNNNDTEEDTTDSIKTTRLFWDIKKSPHRKYELQRKIYDHNDDNLSQISGLNPWFHNVLNKWRSEDCEKSPNEDLNNPPECDEGLKNIYHKLNAKQKLQLDDKVSRNINTYPSEFQFKFLNQRMNNFLDKTRRGKKEDNDSHTESIRSEKPLDQDFNPILTEEKREMIDYFNKMVKPVRPIDFKPEDFKSWYIKMSSKYDHRYKHFPKIDILSEKEDFDSWFLRSTEIMNKKHNNEFSKTLYCRKQPHPEVFQKTDIDDQMTISDDDIDELASNSSSCRSRYLK